MITKGSGILYFNNIIDRDNYVPNSVEGSYYCTVQNSSTLYKYNFNNSSWEEESTGIKESVEQLFIASGSRAINNIVLEDNTEYLLIDTNNENRQLRTIEGQYNLRKIYIMNIGSEDLVLAVDKGGNPEQRFGGLNDYVIKPQTGVTVIYTDSVEKWLIFNT